MPRRARLLNNKVVIVRTHKHIVYTRKNREI